MSGPESIKLKQPPERINASQLVNLLAHVGPGRNIRVRIYSKNGSVEEGLVKWHDDRYNNGPVIIIPNKDPFKEALIPLGGHTVYNAPPKISSLDTGTKKGPIFGEVSSHKIPINPMAENLSFEVIK